MFGLLDGVKMGAAALIAGAAVWLVAVPIAHRNGIASGRAALEQEIASAALAAEKDRIKDDARLNRLSDHDLCVNALHARGMPIDACASAGLQRIP